MPHSFGTIATNTTMSLYGLSTSVAPTSEPVSLEDMKDWLRVSNSSEDDMITGLIESARVEAETLTRRSFVNRTLIQTHADFPACDQLILRASPVSSVTSITYSDQAGDSQTLSSDNYRTVTDRIRPFVRLKDSFTWPLVETGNDTAVTVTMVAGYGATATSVPDHVKTAIKMGAAYNYENRGDGRPIVRLEQVQRIIRLALGPAWIVEF